MMYQQTLSQPLERAPSEDQISRSQSAEYEQLGWLPATSDGGEQVNRRMVGPMQILEDYHQRIAVCYHFQCFAEFPHHAISCRSDRLLFDRGVLVRWDERGELDYPGGRVPGEVRNNVPA